MRTGTVSYRLEDLKKGVIIPIGFVGENEFTRVIFDAEEIYKNYPAAQVSMKVQPPKGGIYPATVTRDGNTVIWQVKEADVANRGGGELQLTFTDGETKIKTYIAKTDVKRSLAGNGPAPDPVQDWIDDAEEVLEEVEAAEIHQPIIGLDGYWYTWNQETGEYEKTNTKAQGADGHSPVLTSSKDGKTTTLYADGEQIAQIQDGEDGQGADVIDDTAGEGDTDKTWSADKLADEFGDVLTAIHGLAVTPEMFGAKGDGETDDSQAIQDAIDAGVEIKLQDDKTYYVASYVSCHHDIKIVGGKNSTIKTKTPQGGVFPNVLSISGEIKKTTSLTSNYSSTGTGDNAVNKFTLDDMDGINIGDIMVIVAEDQYYNLSRSYYYLGATLLITNIYDGHIYTSESMPFDIENTENVTVKIYSAPQVNISGVHFEADLDSQGNYKYLLSLTRCKNSNISDCTFNKFDNGISIHECFNTKISNIELSESKYDNTMVHDSYGITVFSSTNTIIERVIATCAQHAISISGNQPSMNIFIRNCDLSAECRTPGIDTHESIYNLVVEDCVLGIASLNGTSKLNRCKLINNRRVTNNPSYISIYGNHDEKFSQIQITNCIFEGTGITFEAYAQNPIQAFDQIFGNVLIENCKGGTILYTPTVNSSILSNTIKRMEIKNCENLAEIYTDGIAKIESLIIRDTKFTKGYFINNHITNGFMLDGIECLNILSVDPMIHKMLINRDTHGEKLFLPRKTKITFESSNASARHIVCRKNLVSDNADDYAVGQVSGNAGGSLTRTEVTNVNAPSISINENGDLVFQQKNNAISYYVYPRYMFYVPEHSFVKVEAILKNTGETNACRFMAYIVMVDCKTGKVFDRDGSSLVKATAEGAAISYTMQATNGDKIAMAYFYNYDPVALSETTIADIKVRESSYLTPEDYTDEPFECHRVTGDGTVLGFEGINNIMSRELDFHVGIKADYYNEQTET